MELRYAKLTGSAAALLYSILDNGLDDVNRRLALEWTAEYNKLMEDPEHKPLAPDDHPRDCMCDAHAERWLSEHPRSTGRNLAMEEPQYEMYREVFRVVEYRDGAVYRTESIGHQWVDQGVVREGYIYAPPTMSPPDTVMTIRRKRT